LQGLLKCNWSLKYDIRHQVLLFILLILELNRAKTYSCQKKSGTREFSISSAYLEVLTGHVTFLQKIHYWKIYSIKLLTNLTSLMVTLSLSCNSVVVLRLVEPRFVMRLSNTASAAANAFLFKSLKKEFFTHIVECRLSKLIGTGVDLDNRT
jgi:hypothetical protein